MLTAGPRQAAVQVCPEPGFMGPNINLKCHHLPVTIMSFRLSFGLGELSGQCLKMALLFIVFIESLLMQS